MYGSRHSSQNIVFGAFIGIPFLQEYSTAQISKRRIQENTEYTTDCKKLSISISGLSNTFGRGLRLI